MTDNVAVAFAELWVDGVLQSPAISNAPFDFTVTNLTLGGHTLAVIGQDTSANRATNSVTVSTACSGTTPDHAQSRSAASHQLSWSAPGFVLDYALQVTGPWTNLVPTPGESADD